MNGIERMFESLGLKHAPLQEFGGRYITLCDPDGVYFILKGDNEPVGIHPVAGANCTVQIICMGSEFIATPIAYYADQIEHRVQDIEILGGSTPSRPIISAYLGPRS